MLNLPFSSASFAATAVIFAPKSIIEAPWSPPLICAAATSQSMPGLLGCDSPAPRDSSIQGRLPTGSAGAGAGGRLGVMGAPPPAPSSVALMPDFPAASAASYAAAAARRQAASRRF
ncbi:Uncharacterised protein [Mycobacteroides abscessus subsp. abscessus]|nr:Uncharacterised protein [Mycobacteroides abscessus subsp. abscessus]